MYSAFSPGEIGTDLSSVFGSLGQTNTMPRPPQPPSRKDGPFQLAPPSYRVLLKTALNPVKEVNTEPILLETEKALARFTELKTSLKAQLELQAKQNEGLALFMKHLTAYNESSQILFSTMHMVEESKEASEKRKELEQTFGVHMSEHTTKIKNKLQENIDKTSATINDIKEKLKAFASLLKENVKGILTPEELKEIESGRQCPICMTNTVNRVFDTCGHTICNECEPSIRDGTCHICRSQFTKINKLFF